MDRAHTRVSVGNTPPPAAAVVKVGVDLSQDDNTEARVNLMVHDTKPVRHEAEDHTFRASPHASRRS